MSLLPWSMLPQIRPLADAQYFLHQNRWLAWFSRHILNIISVPREGDCTAYRHFLSQCREALRQNQILILYPEGTRGEPECLTTFKSGITHLIKHQAHVPVIPVFLQGLGKALPKGEWLLVPFFCHVRVGEALFWQGSKQGFLAQLQTQFQQLSTPLAIAI
jgi:1-acyl-sn-glycerol-3-phosphate acyltransferase